MSDRMEIEYKVVVSGLDQATSAAKSAGESANQASVALNGVRNQSRGSLPALMMSVRSLNATRLAVQQMSRAITELNPTSAMYAFLNMMQVVNNLTSLTRMLKETTGAAGAAQAILATLTGNWYLIPLAIAAGALVYSQVKSMQTGGPVTQTGLHMLHHGEYVIPAQLVRTTQHYSNSRIGPVFISFQDQPSRNETNDWLDKVGTRILEQVRRGT